MTLPAGADRDTGDGAPVLRYGIAGTGMMGIEHLRSIMSMPGAQVVAASDPDEGSRANAAAEGVTALYDSVEALVDGENLDVLVVASPNFTHRDALAPVWGRPVHVMVEKPLCTTVEDCLAIRKAAAGHPGKVWVGLEYRYMPAVTRLLHEVRSGAVGRPWMVGVREHRFPFLRKVGDWNRFNRFTGGTLVEKCCHFFDLMCLVLDERPARVFATGGRDVNHLDERYDGEAPDVVDNALVVVDFPSGARASLDLCMFAEGSRFEQEISVVGDAGKVEALVPGFMETSRGRPSELVVGSRGDGWPVAVTTLGEDPAVGYQGYHHGSTYREHQGLRRAILGGTEPEVTVDDGVWSVAMGVAAHRSIDEGRPVELSELGL